jgi:hypothetical protein
VTFFWKKYHVFKLEVQNNVLQHALMSEYKTQIITQFSNSQAFLLDLRGVHYKFQASLSYVSPKEVSDQKSVVSSCHMQILYVDSSAGSH